MIPDMPVIAPPAHIHNGTLAIVSITVHALSGMDSAESMVEEWRSATCVIAGTSSPSIPQC